MLSSYPTGQAVSATAPSEASGTMYSSLQWAFKWRHENAPASINAGRA
jgi:hypothetical protein